MFTHKENLKNKRAISELISYVLLITLAIAMAASFWFFIRPLVVNPLPEEECPESINIVLENYSCTPTSMDFYLSNRGLHNVTGIRLKIINNSQDLEYDSLLLLPPLGCEGIEEPCQECDNPDCLGVGTVLQGTMDYSSFGSIQKLAIYPLRIDAKGFYQLCSNAVIRIPVSDCTGGIGL